MAGLGDVEELLLAFRHRDATALEELARRGFDLESRDAGGCTVLMRAAEAGEPGAVQWILEAGARLDVRAPDGRDALMIAAASGRGAVVDLLLAAGASAETEDDGGRRAIDLARAAGHTEIGARLETLSGPSRRSAVAAETPRRTEARYTEARRTDPELTSLADERGLGRFDGDDICLMVRAAPAEVAAWWHGQCRAERWQQDAYGEDIEVRGSCYLVFRFRGHDWTVIRAVHEGRDAGLTVAHAATWAGQFGGESLFLQHCARQQRLVYRYYRAAGCQESETWPPLPASPGRWGDPFADHQTDHYADTIGDAFEDPLQGVLVSHPTGIATVSSSAVGADTSETNDEGWRRAQRRVDDHLRQVGAYVPSWGRLRDRVQRLEVAGLAPTAFERMDFLACRRPA